MIYWDTSAIITLLAQGNLGEIRGVTRPHTLSELYSRTTGKGFLIGTRTVKLSPELAARRVEELKIQLSFVVLTAEETAQALADASKADIRGGRTHDFLHFAAAKKANCDVIYTFNQADFVFSTIPLKEPAN